jgi:hypothetical protein
MANAVGFFLRSRAIVSVLLSEVNHEDTKDTKKNADGAGHQER